MSKREELLRQAQEARSLAAKAHRLSRGVNRLEGARLLEYARELDDRARALEAQAFGNDLSLPRVGPVVTRPQEQAQQQQSVDAADPASVEK